MLKKGNSRITVGIGAVLLLIPALLSGCRGKPILDLEASHVVRVELLSPTVSWEYIKNSDGSSIEKRWLDSTIRVENPAELQRIMKWLEAISKTPALRDNNSGFYKFPCRNQLVIFYSNGRITIASISVTKPAGEWVAPPQSPDYDEKTDISSDQVALKLGENYYFTDYIPKVLQPSPFDPALAKQGYYHVCEFPIPEAWE